MFFWNFINYWVLFLEPLGRPLFLGSVCPSVGVSLVLFLEPLGRPRFFGSEGTSCGVSVTLFLEPLGRPRFFGSVGTSWRVSLVLFLEPLGRPLFLGVSSSGGKIRSWILTSRESEPPCMATVSAGMFVTRSAIRSEISMTLDILSGVLKVFEGVLKF